MHSIGWWKNPDYERCEHLSLSFRYADGTAAPHDHKLGRAWALAFFGEHARKLWVEPPYSPYGKQWDVYHYRLFVDPAWKPILPRKEVYTLEFTALGWKSWSELHAPGEIISETQP
jgi:hypothetical protein